MTSPQTYTTKSPNTVEAMYTGIFSENLQDVIDWAMTILPEDATAGGNGMGGAWIENGSFVLSISQNQYVYVDEDGFHAVDAGAFEMNYSKDE